MCARHIIPGILAIVIFMIGIASSESAPDKMVVYKTVDDADLRLHIFIPEIFNPAESYPCIVFFFGGGWKQGSSKQFYPHCRYFATRGTVAISAEYRIEERHGTTPDKCLKDAKSAIRWVRKHADQLHVDPDRIAAGGGSAGRHLAAATGCVKGFQEGDEDKTIS